MKLEIGVPISALDLASALHEDQGSFLCQSGGQNYLVVAKPGHSIAFGPRPVGRKVVEAVTTSSFTPEPWTITKLSNESIGTEEFERGNYGGRSTSDQNRRQTS